ncbi:MAG: sodium/glucose cotransporter, partial [Mangrovimonas sp.]|nr:sodium/glucose cotransporter [Mangrovimonas sp.]
DQMGLTCLLTMVVIAFVSYSEGKGKDNEKGINLSKQLFKTTPTFNIGAFAVLIILAVLYAYFWN